MKRLAFHARAAIVSGALGAFCTAMPALAEDLMQVYREAQLNDPSLAAARATWLATQERVPQARAGLLPNVSATGVGNINDFHEEIHADLPPDTPNPINRTFRSGTLAVSASQPLYRLQNKVAYDQAKQQVSQADYQFSSVQQDLILRVAQAYFDVLLAEFNVDLAVSQKAAVSENLAQSKRNFEVGVATITDTNEAQAKYDQIVAQEILARNDLDNKRTALRAIIGRFPQALKKLGPGFDPPLPSPNQLDYWVDHALADNLQVRIAGYNFDIATLEVDRQRAGHYPTLDLVASYSAQYGSGATNLSFTALTVPANGSCTVTVQVASANISPAAGWPNSTSGARAAGQRAAERRGGAPCGAVQCANRVHGRQQCRGVGQSERAGGQLGAGRV